MFCGTKCVACGKPIDVYRESHHCDPKWENRIDGRHKQAESIVAYEPTYGKRLSTGFAMIRGLVTNLR